MAPPPIAPALFALLALQLAPALATPAQASPEQIPAAQPNPARAARLAAASLLSAPLAAPQNPAAPSLAGLLLAAERAADEIPGTRCAQLLRAAAQDARLQQRFDPAQAQQALAANLAQLASDLRFEPRMEAPLPQGFPGPTAVHEIEVKHYPRYRLASTPMQGPQAAGAFWRLFGHIKENDIPMTAPVETTLVSDAGRLTETRMAFLYEGPEQGPTSASNPEVTIETIEPLTVLSLGCRGNDTRARLTAAESLLTTWLTNHPQYQPAGPLRVLGYNSPMQRGDQRTFEVQLPIAPRVVPG